MLRIYNTIKKIFIQVNCLYNDNLGIARNTSIGKAAYVKVVDDFQYHNRYDCRTNLTWSLTA